LNWGRASKTTIQPLENLQNKAMKFLKKSNKATLDEIYIQNNILTINNLFKMSAGTFIHSYENNQLPSHFNQRFKSILIVHKYPTSSSGHRLIWWVGDAISICNEPNASQDHIA